MRTPWCSRGRSQARPTATRSSSERVLLDRLEAAVGASLLDESTERVGRFRFVHALINQTLYEGLGATRRSSMHHRVALAVEELYGQDPGEHVAELALHWRLAAVDRSKAAHYAARAGRRALDGLRAGGGGEVVRQRARSVRPRRRRGMLPGR